MLCHLGRTHEVTLLTFSDDPLRDQERRTELLRYCREVVLIPLPGNARDIFSAMRGYLSPVPRSVLSNYSQPMASAIQQMSTDHSFDLVIGSQIGMAPYALLAKAPLRVLEEVEISGFIDRLRKIKPLLTKGRFWLTCQKHFRFVAKLVRQFSSCTVVSEREKRELLRLVPDYANVAIIPNGIQLTDYQRTYGEPVPNSLIYSGSLSYSANLDAVEYFLETIFPAVLRQRPETRLYLTGKQDARVINALLSGRGEIKSAIVFTGYLEDVRPLIAQSWASIVPLRQGGGTRLKILEAFALGTPVVSTRKGCEGLALKAGRDLLVADTPSEFKEAVLRILGDRGLRNQLGTDGRRAVKRYDWARLGPQFEKFLEQTAAHRSIGGGT